MPPSSAAPNGPSSFAITSCLPFIVLENLVLPWSVYLMSSAIVSRNAAPLPLASSANMLVMTCLFSAAPIDAPALRFSVMRKHDVLEVDRLQIDATNRRRDPSGNLARPRLRIHQRRNQLRIRLRRKPLRVAFLPFISRNDLSTRSDVDAAELADRAMKAPVRQLQLELDPGLADDLVPAHQRALAVADVCVAQRFIQCQQRRLLALDNRIAFRLQHRPRHRSQTVIVVAIGFLEPSL